MGVSKLRKKLTVTITIVLILSMSVVSFASDFVNASNWAIRELERANSDGFITEKVAKDFSQNITREEFCEIAVILYDRLGGNQNLETYNPFTDTTNPNVIKAFNAGIINGVGNNRFAPEENLTREQLCVMIIRAMEAAGIVFGDDDNYTFQKNYTDENLISGWAYGYAQKMNDFKIMNGTGDKLEPKAPLIREQAVIMLERTYLREFEIEENALTGYLGNSKNVVIPSGVIRIDSEVFHNNEIIKSVYIPSSVEDIGYAAFREMDNLESVTFNEGLKVIGEASFELCVNLESIEIPNTVEKIEFMAFQDCEALKEVTIPSSVRFMKEQVFYSCESLQKVVFEDSNNIEILDDVFSECPNVTIVCEKGSVVDSYAQERGISVLYK